MVKISSTTAGNSVFDAETITNLYLYGSVSTPDNLYDRIKSSDYVNSLQFQGGVRSVTLDIVVDDFFTQGAGRFALPALDPTIQFFFNTSADNFEAGEYSFDDIRQVFSDLNLGAPLSLILPDSFQLEHAFVSDGMGQEEEDERAYIFNNSSFQLDDNVATDLTFVVEYDAATDTYTRYIENVRVLAFDDNFDLEGGSFSSLIFNALFTADIDPFGIGNRVEFVYRNDNPLDAVYSASDFQADTQSINGFSQTFPVTTSFADLKEGLETNGVLEYENDQFLIEYGTHLNDQLGSIFADKSLLLLGGEGIDTLWLSRSDGGRAYGHEGNDTINGSTGRDMIFGGSDSDILNGGDEADIIYGDFSPENYRGAEEPNGTFGIDMIDGGRGMDFLYGGGEADVINGGRGDFNDVLYHNDAGNLEDAASDRLMGGDGQDGYFVGDADVIFDSDGKGSVVFGNILLTGGDLVAETADACSSGENDNQSDDERTWRNKETGETYRLSNGNLIVEHDGSSITIESWESDQLGITLNDESPSDGGDCQPPESDPDGDGGDGGGGGNGSPDAFASPLVLDLDGDGLDLTLLERSVAFFDIDSDGIRERTSWVGADDGLLVLDRNGNGLIDSGQELFGYGETVSGG